MLRVIDQDLTIVGDGASNLVIDGAGTSRVFFIQSGSVKIFYLTIRNGAAIGGAGGSGGVGGGGGLNAAGAIFVDSTAVVAIFALTIEDSSAVRGAGGTYQPLSDGGGGGLNGAGGNSGGLGRGGIDGVGGTGTGITAREPRVVVALTREVLESARLEAVTLGSPPSAALVEPMASMRTSAPGSTVAEEPVVLVEAAVRLEVQSLFAPAAV
jgi:hypothetical protein